MQPVKKPKQTSSEKNEKNRIYYRIRPPSLTCKVCLLKFRAQSEVDRCMQRHEHFFNLKADCICPACGMTVPKMEITDHFENEHKAMGKTCCLECLAVIPNNTGTELRRHILADHHSAGQDHLCPDCGKSYKTLHILEQHINQHHLKKSTHFCDLCGEHFYHEKQFRRHKVLRHTQKQPYKCNRCDKIFVKRLMAMRHLRFHTRDHP